MTQVPPKIGVCRGKKTYDKRHTIRERDADRDMEREVKRRGRGGDDQHGDDQHGAEPYRAEPYRAEQPGRCLSEDSSS